MTVEWRIIVELSRPIDKAVSRNSWEANSGAYGKYAVAFHFEGCKVVIAVRCDPGARWQPELFRSRFARAVHVVVDQDCKIDWM